MRVDQAGDYFTWGSFEWHLRGSTIWETLMGDTGNIWGSFSGTKINIKTKILWKVHIQICRSLYLILNSVRSCRRVFCFRRITPGKEFYRTTCNKRLCNWSCIMKVQLTVQYMAMDRSSRKRKIKDSHVWECAPAWIMVQLMATKAGRKNLGSNLVELKQGVWRHYV